MRSSPLRIAGFATLASAGLLVAALTTATPAGAAGTQTVRVPVSVCRTATPGARSCDAIRVETREVTTSKAQALIKAGYARATGTRRLGFGPAGGYTPTQLAKAYGINPTAKTTQTVAIVDAYDDPSVKADLATFDQHYGFKAETASSFRVVNQAGNAAPLPPQDEGWAGEITLDVQSVRAVCRSCRILLVEANTSNNADLAAAVDTAVRMGAKIVSNSYGGPENDPANTPAVNQSYNHPGVAILASTGDDGWYGWDVINASTPPDGVPQSPAGLNTVVGVGGTALYLNADGTRAHEETWNANGASDVAGYALAQQFKGLLAGASGSGCSNLFHPQRWQAKTAGYGSLGCGSTRRNGVDIAAVADEFTGFDIYESFNWCTSPNQNTCPLTSADNGWFTFGGTSLASPVVSGMWALAGGPHGVKYPALTLYGHYKSDRKSLYDITVGGTGACDTSSPTACASFFDDPQAPLHNANQDVGAPVDCVWGPTGPATLANRAQCYAQPGYDGVSGVGTPAGLSVFKAIGPKAVISGTSGVSAHHAHTFSAKLSRDPFPGGTLVKYVWTWGDGHSTTTSKPTASHTYGSAGKRTVTLKVTDNYARTGSTHTRVTVH